MTCVKGPNAGFEPALTQRGQATLLKMYHLERYDAMQQLDSVLRGLAPSQKCFFTLKASILMISILFLWLLSAHTD